MALMLLGVAVAGFVIEFRAGSQEREWIRNRRHGFEELRKHPSQAK